MGGKGKQKTNVSSLKKSSLYRNYSVRYLLTNANVIIGVATDQLKASVNEIQQLKEVIKKGKFWVC